MRKISTNCRFPSTNCRAIFAWALLFFWSLPGLAEIAPLEAPKAQTPPPLSSSGSYMFEQKSLREEEQNELRQESMEQLKHEENAKREKLFLKSRQFAGFGEINLFASIASVRGTRSNYHVDPGVQASAYLRSFWKHGVRDLQLWYGLRIAPFGGYGTQDTETSRFAHVWMGPAFGLGRFLTPDDRAEASLPSHLFLMSLGLAGQSRLSTKAEAKAPHARDFKTCPWCNDSLGPWVEFRWTYLGSGVSGIGGLIGVQSGTDKLFTYSAISFSGFY